MRLAPGSKPPFGADKEPKKVVVIIDELGNRQWQHDISAWLVRSGCLWMMAWGLDCGSWDDSVDLAMLEEFNFGEIPEDRSVMTSWHDTETLTEVFRFSKEWARHSSVELKHTLLLHISEQDQERQMLAEYAAA